MITRTTGKVVIPERDTETFISTIGHIDGRIDLYRAKKLTDNSASKVEMGNRELMDLCIMSSKLAYENAKVVENVVRLHWKVSIYPLQAFLFSFSFGVEGLVI